MAGRDWGWVMTWVHLRSGHCLLFCHALQAPPLRLLRPTLRTHLPSANKRPWLTSSTTSWFRETTTLSTTFFQAARQYASVPSDISAGCAPGGQAWPLMQASWCAMWAWNSCGIGWRHNVGQREAGEGGGTSSNYFMYWYFTGTCITLQARGQACLRTIALVYL